jgi:hypothetical protein
MRPLESNPGLVDELAERVLARARNDSPNG